MKNEFSDFSSLDALKNHPVSAQIDQLFKSVIKEEKKVKGAEQAMSTAAKVGTTSDPSELSLDEAGELDINLGGDEPPAESPLDEGLDLGFSADAGLEIGEGEYTEEASEDDGGYGDLSLGEEGEELSLGEEDYQEEAPEEDHIENLGELSFDSPEDAPALPEDDGLSLDGGLDLAGDEEAALDLGGDDGGLSLSDDASLDELSLGGDDLAAMTPADEEGLSLNFGSDDGGLSLGDDDDLSSDAKEKLKEIDAIMDLDASQVNISAAASLKESENLDEPLVSEDLDLGSINFGADEEVSAEPVKEAPKKKKKESSEEKISARESRDIGADLKEISGAYSGEMERMQATISNLRSDREELLAKIQKLEEEKVMQGRQTLSMRAELDERKIELTIIRKKLNEEINELKDRIKLFDEKRLILEEKNRILMQELDKAAQKNKIDVKKVQLRERELEQRLELLKSDAETQIRNRDLKILELKRKIDAMEFDMESIATQEKRSVESRYELEDKLEKAIKTLRGAISVLEEESDRTNALDALKKNIDM